MNENFYLNCSIDLKGNVLRIGTTGTETPFLAESELPEYARLSGNSVEEAVRQSIREMEDEALQKALEDSAKTNSAGPDGEGGGNGQRSSSSPTGNPGKAPAPDISPEDNFTEGDVKEIEGMGFGREEILAELRRFRGDKIQAIAALFAKSLKF